MGHIYTSLSELVGRTPLLEVTKYEKKYNIQARILAKLESFNPGQSAKDRPALAMIEDAERRGIIKPGDTIVEATSGNTGIALALFARIKGYKFRTYINGNVSSERLQTLEALGAEIVKFTKEPAVVKKYIEMKGNPLAAMLALQELYGDKEGYVVLGQHCNPANPEMHEKTTGREIWEDTDGQVDILVASVGTGGTITGCARYLKSKNPNVQIVAVQPGPNSKHSYINPHKKTIEGIHPYKGLPNDYIPKTLDYDICDTWIDVEAVDAHATAKELAETDGLLVGESSGAVIYAAKELAMLPENKGKTIVAITCDSGLRYLSTGLFKQKRKKHAKGLKK